MLDEQRLNDVIDAHYSRPGDQLFRMERLPWYDVASQNADRDAWLRGRVDTSAIEAWAGVLADDARRGLVSRRVRVLSAELTADEAMSCNVALPITSRHEYVRILRHGEHEAPQLLDHDYWVIEPAGGPVQILRMIYTDGGAFRGAVVVEPSEHEAYLRERALAWVAGEPFAAWWTRHGELHRMAA